MSRPHDLVSTTAAVLILLAMAPVATRSANAQGWGEDPNTGPDIDFSASPTTGDAPLEVRFRAAVRSGTVSRGVWSFGDGAESTEPHPTHVYESPGTYSVTLTATGTDGGKSVVNKPDLIRVTSEWNSPPPTTEERREQPAAETSPDERPSLPFAVSFGFSNWTGGIGATFGYTVPYSDEIEAEFCGGIGYFIGINSSGTFAWEIANITYLTVRHTAFYFGLGFGVQAIEETGGNVTDTIYGIPVMIGARIMFGDNTNLYFRLGGGGSFLFGFSSGVVALALDLTFGVRF